MKFVIKLLFVTVFFLNSANAEWIEIGETQNIQSFYWDAYKLVDNQIAVKTYRNYLEVQRYEQNGVIKEYQSVLSYQLINCSKNQYWVVYLETYKGKDLSEFDGRSDMRKDKWEDIREESLQGKLKDIVCKTI